MVVVGVVAEEDDAALVVVGEAPVGQSLGKETLLDDLLPGAALLLSLHEMAIFQQLSRSLKVATKVLVFDLLHL